MSAPQLALVTGASRGIGASVTRSLRARGLEVIAAARDESDLQQLAAECGAQALPIDLTDTAAIETALSGREIDVVVNNAGVLPDLQPFHAHPAAAVDLMIDVNLRAALHVTRILLPGMLARDRGHLFFMGSIAGRHPTPNAAVYAGTKAALHAFAEGLRADIVGSRVRVTVLMPGRVQTHLYDGAFGSNAAATSALYDGFEAIQPADIATVINATLDMPPNVDVTAIEVLPTMQVFSGSRIVSNAERQA